MSDLIPSSRPADLRFNPNLRMIPKREDGRIMAIDVWAPVRGRPLRLWQLSSKQHERAFQLLLQTLDDTGDFALPDDDLAELVAYGIVVANEDVSRRPALIWEEVAAAPYSTETVPQLAARLHATSYATLGPLLSTSQLDALRGYYRDLVEQGWMVLGDPQSRRYWVHNDPIGRAVQRWLSPWVSTVAGAEIKPAYTYAVRYLQGAELPPHVDRVQCEYTVTLLIDFDGAPDAASSWPLELHVDGRIVSVYQRRGDAAIYRGPLVPHSRPPLAGTFSSSLLLHYVAASFEGPLD